MTGSSPIAVLLAGALLTVSAGTPQAETVLLVGTSCQIGDAAFDDETHSLWYDRFWTGSCSGLWFSGCWPGDSWPDLIEGLADKHGRDEVGALAPRLCALGQSMGHEWARDNDVRRISTEDLERWYNDLRQTGDVDAALTHYEALVDARLE